VENEISFRQEGGVFIKYIRLITNTKYQISFVIWWGLCSHDVGSLSRRTDPEPWSSEEMWRLQRGEARFFGTTALSNYEVRVVARVEGGRGGFLGVELLTYLLHVAESFLRS
jgi:hypothetical protein